MKKVIPILFTLFFVNTGCNQNKKIDKGTYKQMVSYHNLGLAYMEEERYSDAANEFIKLVEVAPKEPLVMLTLD